MCFNREFQEWNHLLLFLSCPVRMPFSRRSPLCIPLPLLKDGSSTILNASIVANTGLAALGVYAASKAAVRSVALRCYFHNPVR